jgi:hypothetical protein
MPSPQTPNREAFRAPLARGKNGPMESADALWQQLEDGLGMFHPSPLRPDGEPDPQINDGATTREASIESAVRSESSGLKQSPTITGRFGSVS